MKTVKSIDPLALGGTLFVPASHKNLFAVAMGTKFPALKSMVIDFEDGLATEAIEEGFEQLTTVLESLKPAPLLRFIRPRNPDMLKRLLTLPNIYKIDGLILPKFSLTNAPHYLELCQHIPLQIMPSIEGNELFNVTQLQELKHLLSPLKEKIILIRFGAEDMLRQLNMRRECTTSLFDISATSLVMANLITTFKPDGFEIAAPVFRCFNDDDAFTLDVARDLKEGFISKTIIHPKQIELLNKAYKVSQQEFQDAQKLLESTQSVFNLNETMAEPITMQPWASRILKRATIYGTY